MSSLSVTSTTTEPPSLVTSTCWPGSRTSTRVMSSPARKLLERRADCRHPRLNLGCGVAQIAPRDEVHGDGNEHRRRQYVHVMHLRLLFHHVYFDHPFAADQADTRKRRTRNSQRHFS